MTKSINMFKYAVQKDRHKRTFSVLELYRSFVFVPSVIAKVMGNRKSKLVDDRFKERLLLTATGVNGSAACASLHTKISLKKGMSKEEIDSFLNGGTDFIKPEEANAIIFTKHFTDSRGYPQKNSYNEIVKEYGAPKARVILAICQGILAGNIFGIPFSAFLARLQGKPYKNSSLFYELVMIIMGFVSFPIALIHGLLRSLFGLPNERFDKKQQE